MIRRLAWVTTRAVRGHDEDEPLGLAALHALGVEVDVVDWDDVGADWSAYDRVALRSPWDYTDRFAEFGAWLDRVEAVTELVNPAAMVRWNLDKRYLAELEAAGVPNTPTVFVAPGETAVLPAGDLVVKPAVGAGSRGAASYHPDEHDLAHAHVRRLHEAGHVVLVQPYVASVATDGEWPLVFLDGRFSHAASKRVALPHAGEVEGPYAAETNAPHTATPDQVAVAQAAVDVVGARFGTPAYARIDLVRADDGSYCVLEVELVEPSLFLPYADGSADRLAAALAGPVGSAGA
jgi:glutathione synthase/RimK-type ligase-like ATP-grasp enzyme